jgi:hypothetical protein
VNKQPLDWLEAIFDDVRLRAVLEVAWMVDSRELPITIKVTPGGYPTHQLLLEGQDLLDVVQGFASDLQELLDPILDVSVPPCPVHGCALVPIRIGDHLEWCCPEGDFTCAIGNYSEALWPPSPDEQPGNVAVRLAGRFDRRGIGGLSSFGAEPRDGGWVTHVTIRPDADEAAIRAAAAPISVEFTRLGPMRTVRHEYPATESERAYRVLRLVGAGWLAELHGTLRRASEQDDCDFLVEKPSGYFTRVCFGAEHSIDRSDGPVVFDASGEPFADEGDEVSCVGGYKPRQSRVEGEGETAELFLAGDLRVFE